jgi:hypothetical protein
MRTAAALAVLLALAACSKPAEPANTADTTEAASAEANVAPSPPATDALVGRWIGVEGMYLVVSAGEAPGLYKLEMQYDLDNKVSGVDGKAVGDGIAFTRNGEALTLKPSDGAATGLKYLDGKKDCLTVKEGEGYCRD